MSKHQTSPEQSLPKYAEPARQAPEGKQTAKREWLAAPETDWLAVLRSKLEWLGPLGSRAEWLGPLGLAIAFVLLMAALPRIGNKLNAVHASRRPTGTFFTWAKRSSSHPHSDAQPRAGEAILAKADLFSTPVASAAPPAAPAEPEPKPEQPVVAPARPRQASIASRAPATTPATEPDDLKPVAASSGTLAVSSATSVDIYKDDAYLGSAPISLELPAGPQTLEYRHGSLRTYMKHSINANETTRATIVFDVTVQINAKPWAEVFLDGAEKQDLGQTPLSGVRVPIGSVLVFENPGFAKKRYRVTGNETGIHIVFP
jgi:hypothetical protein